eukprot:scaffold5766_cov256-Pinguiococcus_pyrenoidosus.AAC.10
MPEPPSTERKPRLASWVPGRRARSGVHMALRPNVVRLSQARFRDRRIQSKVPALSGGGPSWGESRVLGWAKRATTR